MDIDSLEIGDFCFLYKGWCGVQLVELIKVEDAGLIVKHLTGKRYHFTSRGKVGRPTNHIIWNDSRVSAEVFKLNKVIAAFYGYLKYLEKRKLI